MYLSYYRNESTPLSELIIDGYDEKYMIENFTHVPVVNPYYWAVSMKGIQMGNQDFNIYATNPAPMIALVDSGTSLLSLEQAVLIKIISNLNSNGVSCSLNGDINFYTCDVCPTSSDDSRFDPLHF